MAVAENGSSPSDHRLIYILKKRTDKTELKLYEKKLIEEYVRVLRSDDERAA